jgi:serine/threonine protein phosphatase PrpC
VRSGLIVGHGSDVGRVRPLNEDYHRVWSFPLGRTTLDLFAVADGMGGASSGEVASKVAMEVLDESFRRYADEINNGHQVVAVGTLVDKAFRLANRRVYGLATQSEGRRGMGTTLTCLAMLGGRGYVGHVGDSRAFMVRGDTIYQLTKDHSWVEEQIEKGLLREEEALEHEWRNLITRALGTRQQVLPDIAELEVRRGDLYVLSTDGLHGLVEPEEILAELKRTRDRQHAVDYLLARANERGGHDNITVVVVEVP